MTDRETPRTAREEALEAQVEVLQMKLRGYEMRDKYNPPEFNQSPMERKKEE